MSKEQTTALSTGEMSIPTVLAAIDAKIKTCKDVTSEKFKTSMHLQPFGDLKETKDITILIKAYSLLTSKSNAYDLAVKELGLADVPSFKEDGKSLNDWKEDIKLQIDITTHKDRLDELKKLKEEAQKFMSADDQKAIFFEKLMKSVSLGS